MPDTDGGKRWSARVTKTSNALDLDAGVFSLDDPKAIARSLKRSAERSGGGKSLPARRRKVLEQAKEELRELYGRR